MTTKSQNAVSLRLMACLFLSAGSVQAADILSRSALDQVGLQRFWQARLPLSPDELIQRVVLLDDNLYLLSQTNRVYAVHARTGILRWSAQVAKPGSTVRGPTHSDDYVFFTAPSSVKVLSRRTGELAGEPRLLKGFIIEVTHDIATITIGRLHGVRPEDILDVVRIHEDDEIPGKPLAQLRITLVKQRSARGQLIRASRSTKIHSGDQVRARVVLPLESVKLPFAASSPAVADENNLYLGAANQRFYSLNILTGFENWQIMTPQTLSATPVLLDDDLYFGGNDGRIVSCTKQERIKNWVFQTEGPIFADLVVNSQFVYAVSNDRLLYCLDRLTGRRVWRKRFDNPPVESPQIAGGRIYQQVPTEGLFVLDAQTGKMMWRRPQGGHLLAEFGTDAYLMANQASKRIIQIDAKSGQQKRRMNARNIDYAVASQKDRLILVVTKFGRMMCLRPKNAPPLRPDELAEVLRDDRKSRALAEVMTLKAAPPKPVISAIEQSVETETTRSDLLDEDDWLASHSTARPVGGSGLVELPDQSQGKHVAATGDEAGLEKNEGDEGEAIGSDEDQEEGDTDLDEGDDLNEDDEDDLDDDDEGDDEDDSDDDSDSGDDGDDGDDN